MTPLKVAIIGDTRYYDIMKETGVDDSVLWDWQVPNPTIKDFSDNIQSGKIDQNTPMLIIDPALYANEPHDEGTPPPFEQLVATMAPFALVAVIYFDDPDDSTPREKIQSAVSQFAGSDENYSGHFYWLRSENIFQSIRDVVGQYINAPDSAEDSARTLADAFGILPPERRDETDAGEADTDAGTVFNDPDQPEYTNSLGRKGTVIAVTSAKGGSGKSTVAYSLAQEVGKSSAIAAAKGNLDAPLDVCLVDMDVYDGQLGFVIGASKPTMLNISKEPTIDQDSVRRNLITNKTVEEAKGRKGDFIAFSALLAPKSPRYVENTPPDMWRDVINVLTTMFDIIILDTSVMYFLDPIIYEVAYPEADKLLYVTDLDIKSILDTTKWMQNVCSPKDEQGYGGFGIGLEKVGIVINKGMTQVGMGPAKIKKILTVATQSIYSNIDPTVPVADLPTPHVLAMIPSYPKLITEASNHQNLGAIINVPQIENTIRRLARAVVPASVAPKLEDAADPEMRERYESRQAAQGKK